MRILCAPVLVGDRLCRIVSPVATLLEVEEWVGEWWEPSSITLTTASQASPAPVALLQARGVPLEDHAGNAPTPEFEIQSLLRASVAARHQVLSVEPGSEPRANGSRRKVFSGNARFRRGRSADAPDAPEAPGATDTTRRDRTSTAERPIPRRRATDDPPAQDSAPH